MNYILILLTIIIIWLLWLTNAIMTKNSVEGFDSQISTEALASLAAMYNQGVLNVTQLNVTGKANLMDLSVTGKSNLAELNVSGNSLISGNLTVNKYSYAKGNMISDTGAWIKVKDTDKYRPTLVGGKKYNHATGPTQWADIINNPSYGGWFDNAVGSNDVLSNTFPG